MAWPIVAAAGIAAAAQLGSSVSASRAAGSATKQGRSFALHQGNIDFARQYTWREDNLRTEARLRAEQRARDDTHIQRVVADAKGAGLHPLFALGAGSPPSQSYSSQDYRPTQRDPTYPPSGSHAAEGIARVGRIAANAITDYGVSKKADELHALRVQKMAREIQLDDMTLMKAASDLKRAEQAGTYWGDGGVGITGDAQASVEAKAFPYGARAADIQLRPTIATARKSMPLRAEVIADDGYRYQMIDPDTGDELSQLDLFQQMVLRHTRKARKAPGRELRIQFHRLARKLKQRWAKRNKR